MRPPDEPEQQKEVAILLDPEVKHALDQARQRLGDPAKSLSDEELIKFALRELSLKEEQH